jgi:hypothetical protein
MVVIKDDVNDNISTGRAGQTTDIPAAGHLCFLVPVPDRLSRLGAGRLEAKAGRGRRWSAIP